MGRRAGAGTSPCGPARPTYQGSRLVAVAAYHGPALRHLPAAITVTTRLPASMVLYNLAPPPTGKRSRPRLSVQS
jgi:hypothetical protein